MRYALRFETSGSVVRATFEDALADADVLAAHGKPARIYAVDAPDVLLATVYVDGGIDYTPEGAAERRAARL